MYNISKSNIENKEVLENLSSLSNEDSAKNKYLRKIDKGKENISRLPSKKYKK